MSTLSGSKPAAASSVRNGPSCWSNIGTRGRCSVALPAQVSTMMRVPPASMRKSGC